MNFYQAKQPLDILVCEDNLGDVYIITNSLKNSEIKYNLHHVANGEAAIDYLQQLGDYKNISRPDLILLDLNLPKKHGFEVLKEIKSDIKLKSIPVVILTSSQAEQDVLKSYELYCSCFVTKPFELKEFVRAIQKIEKFWLNLVQLPPKLAPNG
ncbi:MAG: response regulator [Pleurocapsa sp. MO_192.B19]|nr:response regulator [Pleurocapsa sp. MO_192.B19]